MLNSYVRLIPALHCLTKRPNQQKAAMQAGQFPWDRSTGVQLFECQSVLIVAIAVSAELKIG